MGRENIKPAVSVAIRYIIVALITFFVYLSVTVVITGIFTENIGYTVFSTENGQSTELYRYYFSQGEDIKFAEYQAQGLELTKITERSVLSGTPKFFNDAITQIIGAIMIFAFIHSVVWKLGDREANLACAGIKPIDKLRGLKIGILADIPFIIAYLILIIAKTGLISGNWYALFRFINFQVFTIINLIFGQATSSALAASALSVGFGAVTLLILPLVCHICYVLGYKRIVLSDRIIYKKNKM